MRDSVLSGDLGFLGLGDIIQLIGSNGATGILMIISKYVPEPGRMYFQSGNIINATAGQVKGIQAAYNLFGWVDGQFEFLQEDVNNIKRVINKNRMEIILDGLRMVDDGHVKKLGPITFEKQVEGASEKAKSFGRSVNYPVIKGPMVDYMYVVSEDEFIPGQTIVEEQKHGTWNWTILEGVVDIVRHTNKGPLKILRIGDGAFLGSIDSLLYNSGARFSTAVASTPVQLGVLDSQRLTNEYAMRSTDFKLLMKSLERRLKEVTDKAVSIYLDKINVKDFIKNKKLVIRQSSSELRHFFMITRGEAFIVQHTDIGYMPIAHLRKGDFIGKVPFLDIGHEPLSAAVFASKEFKVKKTNPKNLSNEYKQISPTLKSMIENVATSILVTTRMAYDFQRQVHDEKKK